MEIYIARSGQQIGPFSEQQIHSMVNSGLVGVADSAWHKGLTEWVPLKHILDACPPPLTQPPPLPPHAPTTDAVASPQKKKYPHLLGLGPGVDSVIRPVSKEKIAGNERTSHLSAVQPSVERSGSDDGPMRRLGKGCLTMLAVLCFGLAMKFVAKMIIAGMGNGKPSAAHERKLPEPIQLEPDPVAPGKYREGEKWGDTKEIETVLVATLEIIKRALSMQFTQKQLKEVIDKVAALDTANSRRTFENPSPEKAGWNLISHGIELQYVIFLYEGNTPKSADYFDALLPRAEAEGLYLINARILSSRFRHTQDNEYDLGDGYTAKVSLFKGSTGKGRTVISIRKSP